ncbi:hypothetical protein ACFQHW_03300 [Lapidilactobacillus achengensis]|uniref:Cell surface protein n=1 Tax=Lapidilactobacillus achengensis TaxID=2486000 RepID=A0ABW1ULL4_9LACO|nr:hypothetical protein [Lapidilactobacillus achengensis]
MKTRNITLKRSHLVTGVVVTAAVVLSSLSLGTNLTIAISEDTYEPTISAQAQVAYQAKQQEHLELSKAASQKQAAKFAAAKAAKAANEATSNQTAKGATTSNAATTTVSATNPTTTNTTAGNQATAATTAYSASTSSASSQQATVTSGLNLFGRHFAIGGSFTATASNKVVPTDSVYRWSYLPSVILVDAGNVAAHNAVVQLGVGSHVVIDGQQLTVTGVSGEAWSTLNNNIYDTVARLKQHRAVIQTCMSSGSDPFIRHIFLD